MQDGYIYIYIYIYIYNLYDCNLFLKKSKTFSETAEENPDLR